ncbi:hypothetical protein L6R52_25455 [Myxococcota bacterium]|nr:hypothetical protein [Myxococcota bacterium]
MADLDALLTRATSSFAGAEANQFLWEVRAELEEAHGRAVLYELVLDDAATLATMLETQLPRLTEHLRAKGLPMLGGPSLLVSLWRGPRAFVFRGDSLFTTVAELAGLTRDELRARLDRERLRLGIDEAPKPSGLMLGPGPTDSKTDTSDR